MKQKKKKKMLKWGHGGAGWLLRCSHSLPIMEKVYPDVSRKSLPAKCRLKSEGGCILYEVKYRSEHCWKGWLKLSNSSNWTVWPALEGSLQVLTPEYMHTFHNLQTCTHTHPKYFSSCITAAILQTILKSTILQSEPYHFEPNVSLYVLLALR